MEFAVKPSKLTSVATTEREIRDTLNSLNAELESCRNNLDRCLSSSASSAINSAIGSVENRISITAEKIGIMGNKLDTISQMYIRTESAIVGNMGTSESVSAAKSYNADGSAKEGKNSLEFLLELLGFDGSMDENVTDVASWIAKILGEMNKTSIASLAAASLTYGTDLWDFLYKTATGQMDAGTLFDLTKDGSKLWEGMYKYLDNKIISIINEGRPDELKIDTVLGGQFGNTVGYVALLASSASFLKKYNEALNGDYDSIEDLIGTWLGVGEKGVGTVEAAYKLSNMSNGVVSKAVKDNGGWFTLGETVLSTGEQAFKSYAKYNDDGHITVTEGSEIAIESTVSGLTTLVSGVTYGIVDIDSDAASAALEDWGTQKGVSIAKTIARNPTMKDKFQNGNAVEQAGAFAWGVAKTEVDKGVAKVERVYSAYNNITSILANKIVNNINK